MERIKISSEAECAVALYCFPLAGKKEAKAKWLEKNDLFLDKAARVFALVDTPDTIYFMDAITGSLYQFGNCITSDTLKARGMKRNNRRAAEILMGMKAVPDAGEMEIAA